MNLYRNILKQAGQITWRYKFLWFFGLFATFLGSFGGYEILVNRINANFAQEFFQKIQRLQGLGIFDGSFFSGMISSFKAEPITTGISIIILLVLLALFIFVVWLAVASQVGLVSSFAQTIQGKKRPRLSIGKGIEKGTEKFWSILGINLLSKIIIYGIFFGLSLLFLWGVFSLEQLTIDILYIILFIIFVPIALMIAFILKYAICYAVIENKRFLESIKEGWTLFLQNWLVSLEMALILFFVTFIVSLIGIMFSFLLAIPIYFLVSIIASVSAGLSFWFFILGMALVVIFIVLIGSILTTFKISSWTGLFLRLRTKGGVSKILRWANIKK